MQCVPSLSAPPPGWDVLMEEKDTLARLRKHANAAE